MLKLLNHTAWSRLMGAFLLIGLFAIISGGCKSDDGSTGSANEGNLPPSPINVVAVAIGTARVSLSWLEPATDLPVLGFIVQRSSASDNTWKDLSHLGPDARFYIDSLLPKDIYYYRVCSFNDAGRSKPSTLALTNLITLVLAPKSLVALEVGINTVQLQWKDNSDNETGFRIERRNLSDSLTAPFMMIDTVAANVTQYTDPAIPAGSDLSYRVQAYNGVNRSYYSNYLTVVSKFTNVYARTSGVRSTLNGVSLFGQSGGLVIGASGLILRTEDGGLSWLREKSPISNNLNSVCCINSLLAYIAGDAGKILKTTDGGTTWASLPSGKVSNLRSVDFVNSDTGYIAGNQGIILMTTDGGNSWSTLATNTVQNFEGIVFVNPSVGFAVGFGGTVLRTTNGGVTWASFHTGISSSLRSVAFQGDSTGIAVGDFGAILQTTDQGNTWTSQPSGTAFNLFSVSYAGHRQAIAVGAAGSILYTGDGGTRWDSMSMASTEPSYNEIALMPDGTGLIVGGIGTVWRLQTP